MNTEQMEALSAAASGRMIDTMLDCEAIEELSLEDMVLLMAMSMTSVMITIGSKMRIRVSAEPEDTRVLNRVDTVTLMCNTTLIAMRRCLRQFRDDPEGSVDTYDRDGNFVFDEDIEDEDEDED